MCEYMSTIDGGFTKWSSATIESIDPCSGPSWCSTPQCTAADADVAIQSEPVPRTWPILFINKIVCSKHGTPH